MTSPDPSTVVTVPVTAPEQAATGGPPDMVKVTPEAPTAEAYEMVLLDPSPTKSIDVGEVPGWKVVEPALEPITSFTPWNLAMTLDGAPETIVPGWLAESPFWAIVRSLTDGERRARETAEFPGAGSLPTKVVVDALAGLGSKSVGTPAAPMITETFEKQSMIVVPELASWMPPPHDDEPVATDRLENADGDSADRSSTFAGPGGAVNEVNEYEFMASGRNVVATTAGDSLTDTVVPALDEVPPAEPAGGAIGAHAWLASNVTVIALAVVVMTSWSAPTPPTTFTEYDVGVEDDAVQVTVAAAPAPRWATTGSASTAAVSAATLKTHPRDRDLITGPATIRAPS